MQDSTINYWVFQGNTEYYDIETAIQDKAVGHWRVIAHKAMIKAGDIAFICASGTCFGMVRITGEVGNYTQSEAELKYYKEESRIGQDESVPVEVIQDFTNAPIPYPKDMDFKGGNRGTNFSATQQQYDYFISESAKANLYAMALHNDGISYFKQLQSANKIVLFDTYASYTHKFKKLRANDYVIHYNSSDKELWVAYDLQDWQETQDYDGQHYQRGCQWKKIETTEKPTFSDMHGISTVHKDKELIYKILQQNGFEIGSESMSEKREPFFTQEDFDLLERARKLFDDKAPYDSNLEEHIVLREKINKTLGDKFKNIFNNLDWKDLQKKKKQGVSILEQNGRGNGQKFSYRLWRAFLQNEENKNTGLYIHLDSHHLCLGYLDQTKKQIDENLCSLDRQKILDMTFEDIKREIQLDINKAIQKINILSNDENNVVNIKVKNDMPKHPLNQILYGPPGTGKTYGLLGKVNEILGEDNKVENLKQLQEQGRLAFTTFHPAYGYEEFMEGIRPVLNSDTLKYDRKDGVFKALCDDAEKDKGYGIEDNKGYANIEEVLHAFRKDIAIHYLENYDDNDNSAAFQVEEKLYVALHAERLKELDALSEEDIEDKNYKALEKILRKSKSIRSMASSSITHSGGTRTNSIKELSSGKDITEKNKSRREHSKKIWEYVKTHYPITESKKVEEQENTKPYFMIIDEINRGNVAKIFGELITLIEDTKRKGQEEEITVTLPYSNDSFSVPSNVYIIGTMNTADRSLQALDTALRRRFVFTEMMPDYGVLETEMNKNLSEVTDLAVKILKDINSRIIETLGEREKTIGHAFFIGCVDEADIEDALAQKIIPLIQEYTFDNWEQMAKILLGADSKDNQSEEKRIVNFNDIAEQIVSQNSKESDKSDNTHGKTTEQDNSTSDNSAQDTNTQ